MNPNETNGHHWLTCKLDDGMFSNEVAVTYPSAGEVKASVFVPKEFVSGCPGSQGKVQVGVFEREGRTFAVLPSSYREVVEVNQADLDALVESA